MKKFLMFLPLLALLNCGCGCEVTSKSKPTKKKLTRWAGDDMALCIDGVKYYYFDRSITPAFNKVGDVIICKDNE